MYVADCLVGGIPSFTAVGGSRPIGDHGVGEVVDDIGEYSFVYQSCGEWVFTILVDVPLENLLV